MTALERPRNGKMIAGVCAGLAHRFGLPVFLVRLAFVVSCILPGPQFVLYILLWILLPKAR
ncbi:PspC domain-containing protein [Saccharopolyspora sp. TS4A08]|jgi:phage shock protein PspC (stress-responsive transcriptional regulator)|uniref:Phage shock protein C (PspC) family protein n=3 Tax=Saccharopolyspora TaxID=1835 RepID=A0A1I6RPI0_9PSEU|nr:MULTISPECIES: PspC domain-containing protein [Saccharopolyspora]MDI2031470.1 PspC domain-containing protein [Saccharopolyspora sp. TS4A08]MEB3368580.1 PspC domain-containing protein [Saccharopolyspora sp. S2-29]SFS66556.1 phage shock protein C (PspC) family protein [Saccharopolyspora flava]